MSCKRCFEMSDGTIKLCYECLEAENLQLRAMKCPPISDGDSCICPIEELEEKLKTWHSPENLNTACRIRDERIAELEIAKTIGIQACDLLKERIEEIEAGALQVVADSNKLQLGAVEKIKELEALRDTVSISCNPPADCNDPKVLKTYMKACFNEAEKLYD